MYLFVDSKYKGHHSEYLDIIVNNFVNDQEKAVFIVHPNYLKERPLLNKSNHLSFFAWEATPALYNLLREIDFINQIIKQQNVTKCILLDFNHYFRILPFKHIYAPSIACIYYMPFLRKESLSMKEKSLKSIFFKLILRNINISSIFILNDIKGVNIFNTYFNSSKFKYLIDPVYSSTAVPQTNQGSSSKINFAFLGEVSSRKGIFKLLEAIRLLPEIIIRKVSFTIAGNASKERERIQIIIDELKLNKNISFKEVILERISEAKFNEILAGANIVFALHQVVEGSSGIIGKSALYYKPLIGPKKGLIGELIREYKLGKQINTVSPRAICQAIEEFSQNNSLNINLNSFNKYIEERKPSHFIKTLKYD